jgi:hypothetical protein
VAVAVGDGSGVEAGTGVGVAGGGVSVGVGGSVVGVAVGAAAGVTAGAAVVGTGAAVVGVGCAVGDGEMAEVAVGVGAGETVLSEPPHATAAATSATKAAYVAVRRKL